MSQSPTTELFSPRNDTSTATRWRLAAVAASFVFFLVTATQSTWRDRLAAFTGPRLDCETPVVDLGQLDRDTKKTWDFTLMNRGVRDLEITKIQAECGCLIPKTRHLRLRPGERTGLRVTVDTQDLFGRVTKRVRLSSNDPRRPEFDLTIRFHVPLAPGGRGGAATKPTELRSSPNPTPVGVGQGPTVILERDRKRT